jgi:hypothetical protein
MEKSALMRCFEAVLLPKYYHDDQLKGGAGQVAHVEKRKRTKF